MIAFLDSSALIYLLEGQEPFRSAVHRHLADLAERYPNLGLSISRLAWLEARVGPMKSEASGLLRTCDDLFARPDLIWVELTRDVVELATAIRVRHGLRTPDALQAASGLQLGDEHCFLTGDKAFKRVAGLQVEVLH